MTGLTVWLQGKKTYLSAGALMLLGVVLIWMDQASLGMIAVLQAFGLMGLGARANRHQAEILSLIQGAGQIGADALARNPQALNQDTKAALVTALHGAFAGMDVANQDSVAAGVTILPCGGASRLPSAADLDAVAEEERVRQATSGGAQ